MRYGYGRRNRYYEASNLTGIKGGWMEDVDDITMEEAEDELNEQNAKLFFDAIKQNDIEAVEVLLEEGVDVNAKDNYGATPLISAAFFGYTEIAELLLEAGADPNIKDKDGWTPLMIAAMDGKTGVVKLLLKAGADPNAKNKEGETALYWALKK